MLHIPSLVFCMLCFIAAPAHGDNSPVVFLLDSSNSMQNPPQLGTLIPPEPRVTQVEESIGSLGEIWPSDFFVHVQFWGSNLWQTPEYSGDGSILHIATKKYQTLSRDEATMPGNSLRTWLSNRGHCSHLVLVTDETPSDLENLRSVMPMLLEANTATVLIVQSVHEVATKREYTRLATIGPNYRVLSLSQFNEQALLERIREGLQVLPEACAKVS